MATVEVQTDTSSRLHARPCDTMPKSMVLALWPSFPETHVPSVDAGAATRPPKTEARPASPTTDGAT